MLLERKARIRLRNALLDSLYPSKSFSWASYLWGTAGRGAAVGDGPIEVGGRRLHEGEGEEETGRREEEEGRAQIERTKATEEVSIRMFSSLCGLKRYLYTAFLFLCRCMNSLGNSVFFFSSSF